MYLRCILVLLVLLLNACGSSFDAGDKVIVVPDYDDVRSGYIIGKFVSSKGDKITVDIRKFRDIANRYHTDIEKGDEETYPSSQVYEYEDGRAVVNARKKFFKTLDRLQETLGQTGQMTAMSKSFFQTMASGDQKGAATLAKSLMKEMTRGVRKIKLSDDKLTSLQKLAEEGKLKEWQEAIPVLKPLLAAKESDADDLDTIYSEIHASIKKLKDAENDLADVYKTMPYIDDVQGSSQLATFVNAVNASTLSMYSVKVMAWAQKNREKLKQADAKLLRQLLDAAKDDVANSLNMALPGLKLNNIYNDGEYDDKISAIQDKIDTLNEDHSIYDNAAKGFIRERLSNMKLFKQAQEDSLKQLRGDLSTLGSSEENLEIDLDALMDQAYSAYGVVKALEKDHWLGKWEFNGYRHFKKHVRLSKVTFSPKVSNSLDKVIFSGASGLSLSDGGGKNLQKFEATFTISDNTSFEFDANIRNGGGLKCSFMESQEIQCVAGRASSNLTLYTKEQRSALKAKARAEKKAQEEAKKAASKAAAAEQKMKKSAHSTPAQIDIIAPAATSSSTGANTGATVNTSWNEASTPAWKTDKPKAAAHTKAQVDAIASGASASTAANAPAVTNKSWQETTAPAWKTDKPKATAQTVATIKRHSIKHTNQVQVHHQRRAQSHPAARKVHTASARTATTRPHANRRLSRADSNMLDQGIHTLRALL